MPSCHTTRGIEQGQAVIDQFTPIDSINRKRSRRSPNSPQTYVLLGDQYQKLGRNDYALATGSPAPPCFQAIQRSRKDWPNQPVNDGP